MYKHERNLEFIEINLFDLDQILKAYRLHYFLSLILFPELYHSCLVAILKTNYKVGDEAHVNRPTKASGASSIKFQDFFIEQE